MEFTQDYFFCDECDNKDFKRIYNFSMQFHGVNFSDDLIYDRIIDERYQCTKCQKIFSVMEIEENLASYKKKRKGGI
ncbi:MAG: hypothetical protein JRG79_06240 [Deltaproteobacteria bacterium]|nr:hypothetical protein [Deltaproteobacteria bacterium]MBW2206493.1 hypothetical protein [Deltaproteobacteria bacterium]